MTTATLTRPAWDTGTPSDPIVLVLTRSECQRLGAMLMLARSLAGSLTLVKSATHRRGTPALDDAERAADELRDTLRELHDALVTI